MDVVNMSEMVRVQRVPCVLEGGLVVGVYTMLTTSPMGCNLHWNVQ